MFPTSNLHKIHTHTQINISSFHTSSWFNSLILSDSKACQNLDDPTTTNECFKMYEHAMPLTMDMQVCNDISSFANKRQIIDTRGPSSMFYL